MHTGKKKRMRKKRMGCPGVGVMCVSIYACIYGTGIHGGDSRYAGDSVGSYS